MPLSTAARTSTISLLAASIPLEPTASDVQSQMTTPELDWEDVLYLADGHGITPLLYKLWRELNCLTHVPPAARERLEQSYHDNAARNADALGEFRELVALMERAGVGTIVLKGLPLLYELYSDPAERVLYDFDLLTQNQNDAARGLVALRAAGFTPVPTKTGAVVHKHLPAVWRLNGFVRRGYLFDVAQPRPVEMHITLWDTEWRGLGLKPLPDLWQQRRSRTLDGVTVEVMSPEHTCIHLCVHLAAHLVEREARVGQAIDIARLLAARSAELDWERILQAAEAARVTRFVYLALRAVHALTGAPLPPARVIAALRSGTPARLRTWVEQNGARDVLAMDFRQTDIASAYALTFFATQSWQEKVGVVRFALFPSLDTLHAEYGKGGRLLYARHLKRRGFALLSGLRGRNFARSRDLP